MITQPGDDPRQVFMQRERIGTPKGTRPFIFRRVSKFKNEWACFPFPDKVTGDGLYDKAWPLDRFVLTYDKAMGWFATWESFKPIFDRPSYDQVEANWFPDLKLAVGFLREKHAEIKALGEAV
jgi:hypothetical protein